MNNTQERRWEIKRRAERRRDYNYEGQAAEESLKSGEVPIVIIGVTQKGVPVIAQEDELIKLFNTIPFSQIRSRPRTRFGPR